MAGKTSEWTKAESPNAAAWGQEVDAESQIILEAIGEGFIGTFLEMDAPNKNGIVQAHFEKVTDLSEEWLGEAFFMNMTRDLINKFRKIPNGAQVRVEWTSSMPTGQKEPMRVYSVQWR